MRNRMLIACVVLISLLALAVACGPEPTPTVVVLPPTDTPVPPTDTPVPPTDTPVPPTETPTPTPTPEPLDPSSIEAPQDLDSFVFTEELSWEGTAPDGTAASYQSSTILKYVRDPLAIQLTGTSNEPLMAMALALMGAEGDTMEIYLIEGSMYMPVFGSWMQVSLDVPASIMDIAEFPLDPENLTLGETYTVTQWLALAEAVGPETYDGVEVQHYRFDETAFDPLMLPAAMEVEEASGNIYVTVEGGYLLHMDMTLSGTDLALSPMADEPTLSEGTLEYRSDISSINEPVTINLPEEAVQAVLLPEDIPVPADADQWMAFEMMGMKGFIFASASPPEDVVDFYRAEMADNGWTESSATEDAGFYALVYTQDDRSLELEIGADPEVGMTIISIMPGTADETLEPVEPSAALIVGESFMTALRDADYATAYDLCAPDLQAELGSAEDMGAWMQGNGIVPLEWTFEPENLVESMIQLLGTATFAGDIEAGFELVLIEVDGELLVAGFHVG